MTGRIGHWVRASGLIAPIVLTALLAGCSALPTAEGSLPQSLEGSRPSSAQDEEASTTPPHAPLRLDARAEVLVAQALIRSPDIARIEARLRENASLLDAATAAMLPTAAVQVESGRMLEARRSALATDAAGDADPRSRFKRRAVAAQFQWEVDLFGRARAQRRGAEEEQVAAQADLQAARVVLAHNVRAEVVRLRTAAREFQLAQDLVRTLRESEAMERALRAAGLRSDADLSQLVSEAAEREADLARLQVERELAPLRLRTLTDVALREILELASEGEQACPARPVGAVPLQWLRRRLDVAAAEARLRASVANAESARAAIFPSFSLAARETRNRDTGGDLAAAVVRSTERFIGLNLAWTVLDFGQRAADARAARARAEGAAAEFRRTVLVAAEETEGALSRTTVIDRAAALGEAAAEQSQRALQQSQHRRSAGIDSALQVAQARRAAQERALNALALQRDRCLAVIDLDRALGLVPAPQSPSL